MEIYDLIIVGGGPAGLTASIYASCFHLKHLVIGSVLGGQLQIAPDILNYPGFPEITGKELTNRLVEQAKKRGGEIVTQSVTRIQNSEFRIQNEKGDFSEKGFEIETLEENKYRAKSLILATGTERRKLNIPGEIEYTGKGVHYCAICEKQDYNDKICAVIGGGNSAVQGAVELSQVASKIYIIYRGAQLRGEQVWLDKIGKCSKIEVIFSTVVEEIVGDGEKVTGIRISKLSNEPIKQIGVKDTSDGGEATTSTPPRWSNKEKGLLLSIDKVFIEIGGVPGSALIIPLGVKMDKGGYIDVNQKLETNIPGVFAAGDLVSSELSIEQIASSVGLGARAAASAFAFIKQGKAPSVWGKTQIRR